MIDTRQDANSRKSEQAEAKAKAKKEFDVSFNLSGLGLVTTTTLPTVQEIRGSFLGCEDGDWVVIGSIGQAIGSMDCTGIVYNFVRLNISSDLIQLGVPTSFVQDTQGNKWRFVLPQGQTDPVVTSQVTTQTNARVKVIGNKEYDAKVTVVHSPACNETNPFAITSSGATITIVVNPPADGFLDGTTLTGPENVVVDEAQFSFRLDVSNLAAGDHEFRNFIVTHDNDTCTIDRLTVSVTKTEPLVGFAAQGATSGGAVVSLTVTFPATTANYERVEIRRRIGSSYPVGSCDDSQDQVVTTIRNFATQTTMDSIGTENTLASYRACAFNTGGSVISSITARAVTVNVPNTRADLTQADSSEPEIAGPYIVWQQKYSATPFNVGLCDTRLASGTFSCNPQPDNRVDWRIFSKTSPAISGHRIVWLADSKIYTCNAAQAYVAAGDGSCGINGPITIGSATANKMNPRISGNYISWQETITGEALVKNAFVCDFTKPTADTGSCSNPWSVLPNYYTKVVVAGNIVVSSKDDGSFNRSLIRFCDLTKASGNGYCLDATKHIQVKASTTQVSYTYGAVAHNGHIVWEEFPSDLSVNKAQLWRCNTALNGQAGGCLPGDAKTKVVSVTTGGIMSPRFSEKWLVWRAWTPQAGGGNRETFQYCDITKNESVVGSCHQDSLKFEIPKDMHVSSVPLITDAGKLVYVYLGKVNIEQP